MSDSDKETEQNLNSEESKQQQFNVQKVYIKDMSYESPNAPGIFTEKWEPSINIELNSNGKQIAPDVHEVVLGITVTAKLGEQVAYLVELQQAGIFTMTGFSQQELGGMLGSYCPNLLYPFAREAISDIVTKGGFPQMLLAPVNFDAIYQDHLKQQQLQQDQQASDAVH